MQYPVLASLINSNGDTKIEYSEVTSFSMRLGSIIDDSRNISQVEVDKFVQSQKALLGAEKTKALKAELASLMGGAGSVVESVMEKSLISIFLQGQNEAGRVNMTPQQYAKEQNPYIFKKADLNGNGVVTESEVYLTVQRMNNGVDGKEDKTISAQELEHFAQSKFGPEWSIYENGELEGELAGLFAVGTSKVRYTANANEDPDIMVRSTGISTTKAAAILNTALSAVPDEQKR